MSFLTFAGSNREESVNWPAASMVSTALSGLGHEVESQRLETLNLPLYSQVTEQSTGYPSSFAILEPRFRNLTDSSLVAPNSMA